MNTLAFNVVRALANGEFHSGEQLAARFGVSRASVWNAIQALQGCGLDIYTVRGRGYRLSDGFSALDAGRIAALLGADAHVFSVEVADRLASTNTTLLERAAAGAPHGLVLAAEWQDSGRGRRGRAWHTALGGGLTFSVLWRFASGLGRLSGLSLVCGVAVVRALRALGAPDVMLKWPNDLLWQGRKIGGLLIEVQGDALGPSAVVIGLGLNVRLPREVLDRIDQPAIDLETACGVAVDRCALLAGVLRELRGLLEPFEREGFRTVRAEWERYHAFHDAAVELSLPDGSKVCGMARGVDDQGALQIETPQGRRSFHSGEVSLRAPLMVTS